MDKLIERYELLAADVKHQTTFIDDLYEMDFKHLAETLKEMEKIQQQILKGTYKN